MDYRGFTLAANISIMFTEVPYSERFAAAKAAGFDQVETWWPFTTADPEASAIDDFVRTLQEAEVQLIGLNFFAGNMPAGERGIACRPERQAELTANIESVVDIAIRTGCRSFNLLYGQLDPDSDVVEQHAAAAEAYRNAAASVSKIGGTVLIEPLSNGLNGNYPLLTDQDVVNLLEGPLSGVSGLALLFDTFHLGGNGVDLAASATRHAAKVGHVQLADTPGRGEPGSGGLPIAAALDALAMAGYTGSVACEYRPIGTTIDGLGWVSQ